MTTFLAVLAALAAGLIGTGGAASDAVASAVSLPYGEDFAALASAPGRVLVAEPEPHGAKAIVVRELSVRDRTNRVLTEIAFAGAAPAVSLAANAGGYLIALRDG